MLCHGQRNVMSAWKMVGICFCKEMEHNLARVKPLKVRISIVSSKWLDRAEGQHNRSKSRKINAIKTTHVSSHQALGLRRVSRPIDLNGYKPTLSMIRADGHFQRRPVVDVDTALLCRAQHVEG